jgi:hypothetical protein
MPMFGGIFGGGKAQHPNLDHISRALHSYLGLELAEPADDVLARIDAMTQRELFQFDNLHSIAGMRELLRAKHIHASVDETTNTVTLENASVESSEQPAEAGHEPARTFHFKPHAGTSHIIRPAAPAQPLAASAAPTLSLKPAEPLAPPPAGFEYLEAMEQLRPVLVDLFIKHGKLHTADKDVLKEIRAAAGSTLEARVAALERWQTEFARRARGLIMPKAMPLLIVGGESAAQENAERTLARRFDTVLNWTAKLIKSFEHTGIKFHNKPMWLPH